MGARISSENDAKRQKITTIQLDDIPDDALVVQIVNWLAQANIVQADIEHQSVAMTLNNPHP